MNVWTSKQSESSGASRKGSWLEALARSLRNWWDKFLLGEARSEPSQTLEEAFPLASVQGQEDAGALANLQERVDPVQDWLARVGEDAPQLLSLEEDGTFGFQAPEGPTAPAEELRHEGNHLLPADQPPAVETPSPQVQQRPAARRIGTTGLRDQGIKRTWLRFFQRKKEAKPESTGYTSAETPLENDSEGSSEQVRSLGARVFRKANSHNLTEYRKPRFSEDREGQLQAQPVTERPQRGLHKPSGAGVLLPLFKNRGDHTNRRKPQEAEIHFNAATNDFEQASSVELASSKPMSKIPILPGIAREANRRPRQVDSGESDTRVAPIRIARSAARRPSHEVMWPQIPAVGNRQSTFDKSFSFKDGLSAGRHNVALDELPKSDAGRWPELPEDLPSSDLGSMEHFCTREHLHALDVEQRGGN